MKTYDVFLNVYRLESNGLYHYLGSTLEFMRISYEDALKWMKFGRKWKSVENNEFIFESDDSDPLIDNRDYKFYYVIIPRE